VVDGGEGRQLARRVRLCRKAPSSAPWSVNTGECTLSVATDDGNCRLDLWGCRTGRRGGRTSSQGTRHSFLLAATLDPRRLPPWHRDLLRPLKAQKGAESAVAADPVPDPPLAVVPMSLAKDETTSKARDRWRMRWLQENPVPQLPPVRRLIHAIAALRL
jgi:hypothetical protein